MTSDQLSLHRLNEEEVSIVNELAHRIWPHTFKEILTTDQIEYMLNWMYDVKTLKQQLKEGHLFYSIVFEERPIGFFGLQIGYPEDKFLRIHKIYLLPECQGKGIGRWSMDQIVDIAKAQQCSQLHLNVNIYNNAVTFYKRYGFSVLSEENNDIGSGYWMNDFVMNFSIV